MATMSVQDRTYWCAFQSACSRQSNDLGPLGERYQSFITVLDRVEQHLLLSYPARSPATGSGGVGACLYRQGGVPDRHYQGAARALGQRPGATPSVRLGEYPRAAQRSETLRAPCRGLHEALITVQDRRVTRRLEGREKATPNSSRQAQGVAEPLTLNVPQSCARHQAQRQGLSGILDRLQAAYRRGRRWDSAQLYLDLGLGKRQPSRDSVGYHDSGAGHQPVRPDGRGL